MNIDIQNTQLNKVVAIKRYKTYGTNSVENGNLNVDKLTLSSKAGMVRNVSAHLSDIPDIRLDKVQSLKEQIRSGEYQVKSLDLAKSILQNAQESRTD